jgi:hypothetical protein
MPERTGRAHQNRSAHQRGRQVIGDRSGFIVGLLAAAWPTSGEPGISSANTIADQALLTASIQRPAHQKSARKR